MERMDQPKRLYRSKNRMIGGVLAGFAEYINADPTIIRIAYFLLSFLSAGFPGIIVYIIFWVITPEKPA